VGIGLSSIDLGKKDRERYLALNLLVILCCKRLEDYSFEQPIVVAFVPWQHNR
jgi:hypothetical protein